MRNHCACGRGVNRGAVQCWRCDSTCLDCGRLVSGAAKRCRPCSAARLCYPPSERNQKIVAWALANPCSSLREIGDYYGITRERVRQIIARCGEHKVSASMSAVVPVSCSVCGAETRCRGARKRVAGGHDYRCQSCFRKQRWTDIACRSCGKLFPVLTVRLIRQVRWYKDPLRHCPACMHPPCFVCGAPVSNSMSVASWRKGRLKRISCIEHKAKTRHEATLRAWETRRRATPSGVSK